MRLKVLVPAKVVVDLQVDKVVAKSPDGYFCLLPHHVDFVSALAPGMLSYEDEGGREFSLAIDEGTLAKCSGEVLVATRFAIGMRPEPGERPARMPPLPQEEEETRCRGVVADLENEFMKQLMGEEEDVSHAD
ncbi:MAG: F0F1 ATP synthase subunit epsilon [Thermoleophilia bacterium]|nr:F0F1 ATP synthase subunit epsilon [Thermoleophilia bacterium]